MARYRLSDKHPIQARLQRVFDALTAEGISIHIEAGGRVRVHDARDGQDYYMEDADSSVDYLVEDFPPNFEFKLILERQ